MLQGNTGWRRSLSSLYMKFKSDKHFPKENLYKIIEEHPQHPTAVQPTVNYYPLQSILFVCMTKC